MNSLRLSLVFLAFAVVNANAEESNVLMKAVNVRDGARLVVECHDERLPRREAIGEILETNNGSRIYAERERLIHIAHRECMRGASYVAFVRDASAPAPTLAMVQP